ncbi:TRAMP complex RNA-binding subunit KNAG_0C04130 [Huiozyma naganishii CBS 8797]|uniref:CCHC-type domain-containing protein n=1 Tax=Huiozyma naganishii (strain ATCC MYA-139 / BCRC 22969 / CBS 8797 / KCTC 17520 / NBRC 10181 / NCYC 3082 / Yp74L-3) TaxID=1071383 RepID=J7S643_HUIN7|nr:hypothetical protein KNAG_0C04130 [Kazachstania naganishii CBS 8797]CCK69516.1 hypothetical protein KNAG_0C04130 [Kazachstania naganishii CBS 8797]
MSGLLSEVESMDTLPFVTDTNPSSSSNGKPKLVAPSIEEVDGDPEVLRSLRGQGRYFGVEDGDKDSIKEAVPKCSNCSQRGHLKKHCTHVICTYCGSMDDHYSKQCPKAIKCTNCNENGHYRSQCPQKWKRIYCTLCNSKRHSRDRCPTIWRVYLLRDKKDRLKKVPFEKVYCYNCGSQGHFGDDCWGPRSSRVPKDDGSAFSGDNLDKTLGEQYYEYLDALERQDAQYNSYNNSGTIDYNDYEFDDASYDSYIPNEPSAGNSSRRGGKKRKRNDSGGNNNSARNGNKQQRQPQPTQVGRSLNVSYGDSKGHPLDFPRSNRGGNVAQNMSGSRYASNGANNNNNNYPQSQRNNYKNYNSYKPFRSGVLNMKR